LQLSALDENGKHVDWWFIYKISSSSKSSTNAKPAGNEYLYYDNNYASKNKNLSLSQNKIDGNSGALYKTMNQIEKQKSNPNGGWFFYNDENPQGPSNYKNPNTKQGFKPDSLSTSRGHTKGVLAFDLATDSGFWLVHSTPKFSVPGKYVYPKAEQKYAQSMLCVSLKDATTAMKIAQQMYAAQQPNVYAASKIPTKLSKSTNDDRVLLMKNMVASAKTPFVSKIPFYSRKNQKFHAIAKNKSWGLDFYNDLVGPTLHENLDVETWEHGKTPKSPDNDKIHHVIAMKTVDLSPLHIPFSWSEEKDHAKIAISDKAEKTKWVCVGDINFTLSQEKRGGGTVAFQCNPLWKKLDVIFSTKNTKVKKTRTSKRKKKRSKK